MYIKDPKERLIIYFIYLGNERALLSIRVYSFSSPSNLSKYFKKKYLKKVEGGEDLECKLYKMLLDYKMYF